jgi:CheY-like chemotaxis protein
MLRLTARNEQLAGPAHPGLEPGNYVHLAIADTGEGIRPDHLSRIFDPYFTTKQTGTGLGLAAVYSIIKKHKGYIDVESQLGRGTTFRIWLPALDRVRTKSQAPFTGMPAKFEGRVLFMDDEEIIRKMAGQMLQQLGFAVECAVEGREAVEKYQAAHARGEPFKLVIMDLTVPGGFGGQEAIKRLREIDPRVRAIVSSGYSSDPVLANYRAHGFCGVMAKPYQLEEALRAIREALAGT